MMRSVMGLYADVGAPFFPVTFATDAEGSNDFDDGGYGIVASLLPTTVQERMWEAGLRPGKALLRDGHIEKVVARGATSLQPHAPVSAVPADALSDEICWLPVEAGRWTFDDHITLGEARAVNMLLERLAWVPAAARTKVLSLEDNMVAAWAYAKGRSSAGGLNYLLRKRAALTAATDTRIHLPWVDTERQPADKLSRLRPWSSDCSGVQRATSAPERRGAVQN